MLVGSVKNQSTSPSDRTRNWTAAPPHGMKYDCHHIFYRSHSDMISLSQKVHCNSKYSDKANTAEMPGLWNKGLSVDLLIRNTWFVPTLLTTDRKVVRLILLMHESSNSIVWHFIQNFNENKLSRIATGEIWRTQSLYLLNYFIDFPCPHGCRLIHPSLICRIDFLRSVISLWITSPHRG